MARKAEEQKIRRAAVVNSKSEYRNTKQIRKTFPGLVRPKSKVSIRWFVQGPRLKSPKSQYEYAAFRTFDLNFGLWTLDLGRTDEESPS
jgi:hypothetical protein